jgi:UDP-GlcNAc:undecaprenyl-phosphate GlcNAc-1-phosphate transferase
MGGERALGVFATALVVAALATPVMRRLAVRVGMLDHPADRKVHAAAVPVLGGLALYLAVVGSLLIAPRTDALAQLAAILIGATWVSFWGLWDDRRGLGAATKLAVQLTAALVTLLAGVRVELPVPMWANVALTLLWTIGITNAINLLDNMDGLASGVTAVAAGWFLVLAAMNGQVLVSSLAAAVLGACAGFLVYNFNPASIFMGDSGSLFLGFVLAGLGVKLRFPANVPWVTWMVPVLVLGVAVFDTTLVVVSRLRRGKNPLTTPGKDHVSHRLVARGWTTREAVLLIYLAGCCCGGVAIFASSAGPLAAYAVLGMTALGGLAALVWFECARPSPPASPGGNR